MLTYTAQSKWNFEEAFFIMNVITQVLKDMNINPGSYVENSLILMKVIQKILKNQNIHSDLKEIKNIKIDMPIGYGLDCAGAFFTPMGMDCARANPIFLKQKDNPDNFTFTTISTTSSWETLIEKIIEEYESKLKLKPIDFEKVVFLTNIPNSSFSSGIAFEVNPNIIQEQTKYIEKIQSSGKDVLLTHGILNSIVPNDIEYCLNSALEDLEKKAKTQKLPDIVQYYFEELLSFKPTKQHFIFSNITKTHELIGKMKNSHYLKIPVNLSDEIHERKFLHYLSVSNFALFMKQMGDIQYKNYFKEDIFPLNKTNSGLIHTDFKKQPSQFVTSREDMEHQADFLEKSITRYGNKEVGRFILFEKQYHVENGLKNHVHLKADESKPKFRF